MFLKISKQLQTFTENDFETSWLKLQKRHKTNYLHFPRNILL